MVWSSSWSPAVSARNCGPRLQIADHVDAFVLENGAVTMIEAPAGAIGSDGHCTRRS